MKSNLVVLALTATTLVGLSFASQNAYCNEPAQTPLSGKFFIQCKGLKWEDSKNFAAKFFIDPAHSVLTYQIALEGAPVATGAIHTVNQAGFKTDVSATDFYGNGQILDFAGATSKLVHVPAYDPPVTCPRCSPGWPAHDEYQSVSFAGISLYQAFPYTNKAYIGGNVSYPQSGALLHYAFKNATCEIHNQQ